MTGVVHVVAHIDEGARAFALATALHDPGRPQLVVAGDASAHAERVLGARLRIVRALRGLGDELRVTRLVADAAALLDLARVLDALVDRLRSPIVIQTYPGKAGVLARLAARSIRGAVCVHTAPGAPVGDDAVRDDAVRDDAVRDDAVRDDAVRDDAGGDDAVRDDAVRDGAIADERLGADVVVVPRGVVDGGSRRVIVDGIDPAPYAALLAQGDARHRASARATLGVTKSARLVITNNARAAQLWCARDPRGDVLPFVGARARAPTSALAQDDHDGRANALLAADVALLVRAPLGDVLAVLAAGLPVVVVGREHDAQLAWSKRARLLPADATLDVIADAIAKTLAARPLAAATRARHARLPRELTAAGALQAWAELYDELVGPPRPTGEMARRRPLRRRR